MSNEKLFGGGFVGSANKTTNLGLPQWLGNEYFERTDMNEAFKAIDEAQGTTTAAIESATSDLASAKAELEGAVTAAKSEAAADLASAKTELNSEIKKAKSEAATNLASAKTELQNNINALGTKVEQLWCAMLEAGYAYTCNITEDYPANVDSLMSDSSANATTTSTVADLYCEEILNTTAGELMGVKETYFFNAARVGTYSEDGTKYYTSGVDYDTVIEVYTIGSTTRKYKLVADADGNWSGVWS